ncbi:MAG: thermonuclease family protein [Thermodesulfobacteriota bacterium]
MACKSVWRVIWMLLGLAALGAGAASNGWSWSGRVVEIASPQVLVLTTQQGQQEVALYGVDSVPGDHPQNEAVRTKIKRLLAPLDLVEVVPLSPEGGTEAHVYIEGDGENLAEELVRQGYAWVDRAACRRRICTAWRELEAKARQDKRGLWADPSFPPAK